MEFYVDIYGGKELSRKGSISGFKSVSKRDQLKGERDV